MPPDAPALDETMLAMDVVDTLRHADRLVERELRGEERRSRLKDRLREIYATQGIEVPDRILEQGVATLEEQRFAYQPTPPSFARSVAMLWVTRATWGRKLLLALGAVLLLGGGWYFGLQLPAERREAAQRIELSTGIPEALRAERERIAAAGNAEALGEADRLAAEGQAAAQAGALEDARDRLARLREVQATLTRDYTVRIVSRPGEPSGVWRVPQANPRARNFYLIVEAVGRDGRPVEIPVTSEEDGRRVVTSRWGLRVTAEEFERVRRDKLQDGVIGDPVVGRKRAGTLAPEWSINTTGGAILQW
ncbi:DUF6384 family protein [Sabulicella glaciei]|uniref:DUF6384 family protein n=1 Tax=Sabulicella glaciei TaxID=2984948 RepID=A0ABT3P1W4_9PROT|nr:DUF6384 family protein [Roseococcus sp. MDT2-1-1]MCW8087744.1 DUF6384 family protein [Roseococcus sp. MDT2-1-1]